MPEALRKLFRNAKKVLNASKNKKLKEQAKANEGHGKRNTPDAAADDDGESVDLDDLKQVR